MYKINAIGHDPPLRLLVHYNIDDPLTKNALKDKHVRDLKIEAHISDKPKLEERPVKVFKGPISIVLNNVKDEPFGTFIYLAFKSIYGCSITVKAKFNTHEVRKEESVHNNIASVKDKKLDFHDFKVLFYSDQKNKYHRLMKEVELELAIPLHASILLKN
jgi:hypothetical protein